MKHVGVAKHARTMKHKNSEAQTVQNIGVIKL
jgi:hypothetical protein